MSLISCSGCGGQHSRPGGTYCKYLRAGKFKESEKLNMAAGGGVRGTNPISINWSTIVPPDELSSIPGRDDSSYLGFCEKIISELNAKVEESKENSKVLTAEATIIDLMSQLHITDSGAGHSPSPGDSRRSGADLSRHFSMDAMSTHRPSVLRQVVEVDDCKEYKSKLRPESHLIPAKTYEQMNYRDLVLGMAGVRSHLVHNNRPVIGYDSHCLFIKRKSATFLYSNIASILYDRFVSDRVLSGEYIDFPSSCSDAALEFYCDSYRRDGMASHGGGGGQPGHGQRSGGKPWSGYPYPYCYFWNEMPQCAKKNCTLKHECGFCQTIEHKSKDCVKSSWKKQPSSDTLTPANR